MAKDILGGYVDVFFSPVEPTKSGTKSGATGATGAMSRPLRTAHATAQTCGLWTKLVALRATPGGEFIAEWGRSDQADEERVPSGYD